MRPVLLLILLALITAFTPPKPTFLEEQQRYPRFRQAQINKGTVVDKLLKANKLTPDNCNILITACKLEQELCVYAKSKTGSTYTLLKKYAVCASSGKPGPKRAAGDGQVPEGFYYINAFNPASNYHLSLGLNYPNKADAIKSIAKNKGGDIFIHGNCVTIGCLPLTDALVEEVYLLAVYAANNGQGKIPVYLFPYRMTEENLFFFSAANKYDKAKLPTFWANLQQGYDLFTRTGKAIDYGVNKEGDYTY